MFNSGEDLIIDSYRIPWLIWIQLLVMLLVIILFFFYTLDLSLPSTDSASLSSSRSTVDVLYSATFTAAPGSLHNNSQVRENQSIKETGTGTSRGIAREDVHEIDGGSSKDGAKVSLFGRSHHPCHIFGLAKQAFLKCLGLDFSSESPSNNNQRKEH